MTRFHKAFIFLALLLGLTGSAVAAEPYTAQPAFDRESPTDFSGIFHNELRSVINSESSDGADTGAEPVIEVYSGINLVADDRIFTPTDANGKEVMVFAYNGTTYLPARAIANLLGIGTTWDNIDTVLINTTANLKKNNNTPYREYTPLTKKIIPISPPIKIKIDGEIQSLTDVNGTPVAPIAYEGTIYIPIRNLAKLLNVTVAYDGLIHTVFIGTHMTQPDPNMYSDLYQKEAQAIVNRIELLLNQLRGDYNILNEQSHKVLDIKYNQIADIVRMQGKDSACYQELRPFDQELEVIYKLVDSASNTIINSDIPWIEESFQSLVSSASDANAENISKYRFHLRRAEEFCTGSSNIRLECSNEVLDDYIIKAQAIIDKY